MRLVKAAGAPAAMALASLLVACSSTDIPASAGSPQNATGGPYRIKGRWYTPGANPNYDRVGVASWYGTAFHGRKTANGERFDMNALTAAHPTLPLSTIVRVTNLDNGLSVAVRINDRGPFARNRIIDMSRAGARALGFDARGTARVRVTALDGTTLIAEQEGQGAQRTDDEPGNTATTSSRPRQGRGQGRSPGQRHPRRGRPAARPSYLGLRPMRRRKTAPKPGCAR